LYKWGGAQLALQLRGGRGAGGFTSRGLSISDVRRTKSSLKYTNFLTEEKNIL